MRPTTYSGHLYGYLDGNINVHSDLGEVKFSSLRGLRRLLSRRLHFIPSHVRLLIDADTERVIAAWVRADGGWYSGLHGACTLRDVARLDTE